MGGGLYLLFEVVYDIGDERAGLEVKRMSVIPPIKMWDKACIC
jgi:hypothetical protein